MGQATTVLRQLHGPLKALFLLAFVIMFSTSVWSFIGDVDYLYEHYGIDSGIGTVLFIIGELVFDVSIIVLLFHFGIQIKWKEIYNQLDFDSLEGVEIRGVIPNAVLAAGLLVWFPWIFYVIWAGWGRLPIIIVVFLVLEHALTCYFAAYLKGWVKL